MWKPRGGIYLLMQFFVLMSSQVKVNDPFHPWFIVVSKGVTIAF